MPKEAEGTAETGAGEAAGGMFAAWLADAQAQGLEVAEQVWQLHVVQGRSPGETARLLGLTAAEVAAHRAEMLARLAARGPRTEADFQAVREELRDRLVSILEDASRARDDPRLLAVRQRVCDQIADLYGLNMQRRAAAEEAAVPYSVPPEKSEAVLEMAENGFGRKHDIRDARAGLALTGGGVGRRDG